MVEELRLPHSGTFDGTPLFGRQDWVACFIHRGSDDTPLAFLAMLQAHFVRQGEVMHAGKLDDLALGAVVEDQPLSVTGPFQQMISIKSPIHVDAKSYYNQYFDAHGITSNLQDWLYFSPAPCAGAMFSVLAGTRERFVSWVAWLASPQDPLLVDGLDMLSMPERQVEKWRFLFEPVVPWPQGVLGDAITEPMLATLGPVQMAGRAGIVPRNWDPAASFRQLEMGDQL